MGWLFIFGGIFTVCGALFDWDFFMNHRKTRFFVKAFGRPGARIFYAVLGCVLIGAGIGFTSGIIPNSR